MKAINADATYLKREDKFVFRFNGLIEGKVGDTVDVDDFDSDLSFWDNNNREYIYYQPIFAECPSNYAISFEFLNDELRKIMESGNISFPLYTCFSIKQKKFYLIRSAKLIKEANSAFMKEKTKENAIKVETTSDVPSEILKYGRNLNSIEYPYFPAITREQELFKTEIKLLQNKSVVYTGPHGVGKTSLAEGLAYLIQKGKVSNILKNKVIVEIYVNNILAGSKYRGDFEEKVKSVIEEVRKNPSIILFIDEVHTILGAGTGESQNLDLANILKPYLARGEITIIGATTDDEYNKYIKEDAAFKSRLTRIPVLEPNNTQLRKIIDISLPYFENKFNLKLENNAYLDMLIKLSYHRKYDDTEYNPRLILGIIGDAFAISTKRGHSKVTIDDIVEAINMCSYLYSSAIEDTTRKLKSGVAPTRTRSKIIMFPGSLQN